MLNMEIESACEPYAHKPLRSWQRPRQRLDEWTEPEGRTSDPRLWVKERARDIVQVTSDAPDVVLYARFKELRDQWERETFNLSNIERIVVDDSYQRIIGMGPRVLPLIFSDLRASQRFWFPALRAITGADPINDDDRGDFEAMRASWLDWAAKNGYR
jgi:hypothetical protein